MTRRQNLGHCPLCRTRSQGKGVSVFDDRYGEPGLWALRDCAVCGGAYLDPRPHPAALAGLYRRYYHGGAPKAPGKRRLPWHSLLLRLRSWLRQDADLWLGARSGEKVADVGAGAGWPRAWIRERRIDYLGIEVTPGGCAVMEQDGLQVFQGTLERVPRNLKGRFDLVCLSQVLEHLPDPVRGLAQAKALLRPGGRILLAVPNWAGRSRRRQGAAWINVHAPYHLVHFSPDSLALAAEKAGLRLLRCRTLSPLLWLGFQARTRPVPRGQVNPLWQQEPPAWLKLALWPRSLWDALRGEGDCLMAELA
jgi:SAM-dependent methyltransferase